MPIRATPADPGCKNSCLQWNRLQVVRVQEEPLSAESRRYINLPNRPADLPFSDAVLLGNTLYISGRIGIDPATGEAPASIDAELELLFDGFQAVLRQAGMTMDDLVWVQVLFAGCFFVAAVQLGLREAVLARVSRPRVLGIGHALEEGAL